MTSSTRRWMLPGTACSYLIARAGDLPVQGAWHRVPALFMRAPLERAIAAGTSVVHQLHEAVGGPRRAGLFRSAAELHRREMVRNLEQAFRMGVLVAYRRTPVIPGDSAPEAASSEPERPPENPIAEEQENHVTIHLVGEDGAGIPWIRYRVTLPDHSVREGTLDGTGFATVRGKFSGECKVAFPELDAEAWAPA